MDSSITDKAQGGPGERLRQARVLASDKELRRVGAAAKALGVSTLSLQRYEEGERDVPLRVLQSAVEVFDLPIEFFLGQVGATKAGSGDHAILNRVMIRKEAARVREAPPTELPAPAGARTFATDAEKISYAIGVLDMANAAKADLARCLDAAMSALIAPLTSPTTTSGGADVAEKLERHRAARNAPTASAAVPAAAGSRSKARRSAQ